MRFLHIKVLASFALLLIAPDDEDDDPIHRREQCAHGEWAEKIVALVDGERGELSSKLETGNSSSNK